MTDIYRRTEIDGIPRIPGLKYIESENCPEYVIVEGTIIDIWNLRDILTIPLTEYFETAKLTDIERENTSLRFVDDKKSGLTAVTGRKSELNKLRRKIA